MQKLIIIICLFLLSPVIFSQEGNECEKYHKGFFKYEGKHFDLVIYRKGNYQIEYNIINGEWVTTKLNWLTNCKYSFTYISTNMEGLKGFVGSEMIVDIVKSSEKGYYYQAKNKGETGVYIGKIIFLVEDINRKVKNRIKRKLKATRTLQKIDFTAKLLSVNVYF